MPYQIRYTGVTRRDLGRLPARDQRRVQEALVALRENPRPRGCAKLRGSTDAYRIRIGDYRAIYDVDDDEQAILVLRA